MTKKKCKGCDRDISHKHPNAKFHSQKCKDKFWNKVNPRGHGLLTSYPKPVGYDRVDDDDQSWDSHKTF